MNDCLRNISNRMSRLKNEVGSLICDMAKPGFVVLFLIAFASTLHAQLRPALSQSMAFANASSRFAAQLNVYSKNYTAPDKKTFATRTSVKNGNWNNPKTWGGTIPEVGDDVIIADGTVVTIDVNPPALSSLTIGQGKSGILRYE